MSELEKVFRQHLADVSPEHISYYDKKRCNYIQGTCDGVFTDITFIMFLIVEVGLYRQDYGPLLLGLALSINSPLDPDMWMDIFKCKLVEFIRSKWTLPD